MLNLFQHPFADESLKPRLPSERAGSSGWQAFRSDPILFQRLPASFNGAVPGECVANHWVRINRSSKSMHPFPNIFEIAIRLLVCKSGLKTLKYGAASQPEPLAHCQPPLFEASS
jgi:hypothetical protein